MVKTTILEEIIEYKKSEIAKAKANVSLAQLEAQFGKLSPMRDFCQVLRHKVERQEPAIIAEIKRASPSGGLIREDFRPAEHARDYAENGATCLSIITDEKYFQGKNIYLEQGRAACALPVIRKDFMVDPYQIAESKVLGADCVLLIVAALQQSQLIELAAYANEISIDMLVEVHNSEELDRALALDTDIIGINNRNLHTFETSLKTTLDLAASVPPAKIVVTESGINTAADVQIMTSNGIFGFLVGESFMRSVHPGKKLRELFFANESNDYDRDTFPARPQK